MSKSVFGFIPSLAIGLLAFASNSQASVITDSFATWAAGVSSFSNTTDFGPGSEFTTATTIALAGGGNFSTSAPVQVRNVGSSWSTWSGGYTGQVLWSQGLDALTLFPSGISALGFEVEPDSFSTFLVTLTLSTGQTISDPVNGDAGASFFGYYGGGVSNLTISVAGNDFAFGNIVSSTAAPVPLPAALPLFAGAVAGLGTFGRWRKRRSGAAIAA